MIERFSVRPKGGVAVAADPPSGAGAGSHSQSPLSEAHCPAPPRSRSRVRLTADDGDGAAPGRTSCGRGNSALGVSFAFTCRRPGRKGGGEGGAGGGIRKRGVCGEMRSEGRWDHDHARFGRIGLAYDRRVNRSSTAGAGATPAGTQLGGSPCGHSHNNPCTNRHHHCPPLSPPQHPGKAFTPSPKRVGMSAVAAAVVLRPSPFCHPHLPRAHPVAAGRRAVTRSGPLRGLGGASGGAAAPATGTARSKNQLRWARMLAVLVGITADRYVCVCCRCSADAV